MTIFLYNEGGPLYSVDAISRLAELEIMKKRASTEAYQAQREDVQFRVWSFLTAPPLSEFFRCPDASSLTSMSSGLRWRSATARGDGH